MKSKLVLMQFVTDREFRFAKIFTQLLVLVLILSMSFPGYASLTQTVVRATEGADSDEEARNLFDSNERTKWCVTGFRNAFVIWEVNTAFSVSSYTITTANDNERYEGRNPSSWTLYGCNPSEAPSKNYGGWTVIDSVVDDDSLEDENYEEYDFSVSGEIPAYKYFMLEITETKGASVMQMSEFTLHGNTGTASPDAGADSKSSSSAGGNAGASSVNGVVQLSDGSFQTQDGRLRTTFGKAMVLRDGTEYTGTAAAYLSNSRADYWVDDFYRDETIVFAVPYKRLMTGDTYTLNDLIVSSNREKEFSDAISMSQWSWSQYLGVGHDDTFTVPTYSEKRSTYSLHNLNNVEVKVLYMEQGVAIVYYLCATFDTSPYKIELLSAIDLSYIREYQWIIDEGGGSDYEETAAASSSGSGSNICNYCGGTGTTTCLTCHGTGTWETTTNTPNYGGLGTGGMKTTIKDCPYCTDGQKKCNFCNGTGVR